MSKRKDLQGLTFGKLKVLKYVGCKKSHAIWEVECICGNITEVQSGNLLSGNTTGCNKCKKSKMIDGNFKHRLHKRWRYLKYKDSLCDEWQDFKIFLEDVENKFKEKYSLRRIDNSMKHSPYNSYWTEPRTNKSIKSKKIYFR